LINSSSGGGERSNPLNKSRLSDGQVKGISNLPSNGVNSMQQRYNNDD
jgi:hypothetical protein